MAMVDVTLHVTGSSNPPEMAGGQAVRDLSCRETPARVEVYLAPPCDPGKSAGHMRVCTYYFEVQLDLLSNLHITTVPP